MSDLFREGYSARKSRDEDRELRVFRQWVNQSNLSDNGLCQELEWEKGLSGFKKNDALNKWSDED